MATTAGDIYVRSGASGSFTSVQYVQGGWITVASASDMTGIYHDRLRDGQIVWVEHTEQLYVTRKFVAFSTPGYGGTDDSASFHTTNLGISGGGGGAGDITSVVAGNGLSGGATTGDATVTLDTNSSTFKGGVSSVLTPLNNFSGSANTSIAALNTFTGSNFGIFTSTGSFKSTTNNLDITGSVRVSNVLRFKELSSTPTYEEGALFYSASNFYLGLGDS